jgi:hypothetical protein
MEEENHYLSRWRMAKEQGLSVPVRLAVRTVRDQTYFENFQHLRQCWHYEGLLYLVLKAESRNHEDLDESYRRNQYRSRTRQVVSCPTKLQMPE